MVDSDEKNFTNAFAAFRLWKWYQNSESFRASLVRFPFELLNRFCARSHGSVNLLVESRIWAASRLLVNFIRSRIVDNFSTRPATEIIENWEQQRAHWSGWKFFSRPCKFIPSFPINELLHNSLWTRPRRLGGKLNSSDGKVCVGVLLAYETKLIYLECGTRLEHELDNMSERKAINCWNKGFLVFDMINWFKTLLATSTAGLGSGTDAPKNSAR